GGAPPPALAGRPSDRGPVGPLLREERLLGAVPLRLREHHLTDPWTCNKLDSGLQHGNQSRGSAGSCARPGENCKDSGCCQESGQRCYRKDSAWAGCRATCKKGEHDPYGPDMLPWSCEDLGPRDNATSDRVLGIENATQCSDGFSNCQETRCCSDVGFLCYEKNSWWAQCKESCKRGENDTLGPDTLPWSCRELGSRNHGHPAASNASSGNGSVGNASGVSASGAQNASDEPSNCSAVGHDCTETQCCSDEGLQCFEKNLSYSGCLAECTPGLMPWTCARSSKATPESTTSRRPSTTSAPRSATTTRHTSTGLSASEGAAPSTIDQLSAQVAAAHTATNTGAPDASNLSTLDASRTGAHDASSVLFLAFDALEEELEESARVRALTNRA
ncbi:unnamed protein product, partial [Prorocentrum cordatum]